MADHADVRVPPPLIYLVPLVAAALLRRRWPLQVIPAEWTGADALGFVIGLAGVVVMLSALRRFRKADTSPIPIRPSRAMVIVGPYRWTRNPMYLGFTAVYVAVTLLLRSAWPIIFFPLVWWTMNSYVIGREERYLTARFGDAYREYQARVRRWI